MSAAAAAAGSHAAASDSNAAIDTPAAAAAAPALTTASLLSLIRPLVSVGLASSRRFTLRRVLLALSDQLGECVLDSSERRRISELVTQVVRECPRPASVKSVALGRDGLSSGLTALDRGLHPIGFSFAAAFDASADGEVAAREFEQFDPMMYESPAGVHIGAYEAQRTMYQMHARPSEAKRKRLLKRKRMAAAAAAAAADGEEDGARSSPPVSSSALTSTHPTAADDGVDEVAAGLNRPVAISDELASFLSLPPGSRITRPTCIRQICNYVKEHDLQDRTDRRAILCDAPLRQLFAGEERVTYFTLNKFLTPHFEKAKRVYKRKPKGDAAARTTTQSSNNAAAAGSQGTTAPASAAMSSTTPAAAAAAADSGTDLLRLSPRLAEFFLAHTSALYAQGHTVESLQYLTRRTIEHLMHQYVQAAGIVDPTDESCIHLVSVPPLQLLLGVDPGQLLLPGMPDVISLAALHAAVGQHLVRVERTSSSSYPSLQADAESHGTAAPLADEYTRAEAAAIRVEQLLAEVGRDARATVTSASGPSAAAAAALPAGVTDLTAEPAPSPEKKMKTKAEPTGDDEEGEEEDDAEMPGEEEEAEA